MLLHSLVMHVAVPSFSDSVSLTSRWIKIDVPGRHERQHNQRVPEGIVILESRKVGSTFFSQAKHLHVQDREEDEQSRPEQEQVADGWKTRTVVVSLPHRRILGSLH